MGSGSWIRNLLDPGSGIEKFGSVINIPDPQHWFLSLSISMRLVEEQCPGHGELNCPQENPWLHEVSPVGFAFSTPTALPDKWNYKLILLDRIRDRHRFKQWWASLDLWRALQNMECRNFFFVFRDHSNHPGCGPGPTDPIIPGSNPDLDPKN
jgi:hypothetical protein